MQLIQDAALSAIDLIENGDSPVSAIAKVATVKGLTDDQTTRVCQLYNRSRQLNDRLTSDSEGSRFAVVDAVVDPSVVINKVKERRGDLHVSSKRAALGFMPYGTNLLQSPEYISRKQTEKVAELPAESPKSDPSHGLYHGFSYNSALTLLSTMSEKLASLYTEASHLVGNTRTKLLAVFDTVEDEARRVDDASEYVKQACYTIAQEPFDGLWLFQHHVGNMLAAVPSYKRASFQVEQDYTPEALYASVDKVKQAIGEYGRAFASMRERLPEISSKIAQICEQRRMIRSNLGEGGVYDVSISLGKPYKEHQLEHIEKLGNFFSSFMGTQISKPKPPGTTDVDQARYQLKLGQPQHEALLGSLRARAALQQLIVDDPVLSAEDPNVVANAFNELASYAPEALQTPAVMRSALRQYLMNNTSAADLGAIRQLERSYKARPTN